MFLKKKKNKKKSGKRDSNPRPRPWQGRALPTELFPQQEINGEEEETRTPTTQLSLPPQSSASTNSATSPTLSHSEYPCPRQDSNLHVVKHTHLKRARLPIPPLGHKKILFLFGYSKCGAENGTRTRDPDLGKVVLYQLSYFRKHFLFARSISLNAVAKVLLFSEPPKLFCVFFQKSVFFIVFLRFSPPFCPIFRYDRGGPCFFSPSCHDSLRRRKCGEFPVRRQDAPYLLMDG